MKSTDCQHPKTEWPTQTRRKNVCLSSTSAKLRPDLEPCGRIAVSYRDYSPGQIPALTSPASPPIIPPCLAPMPSAASRATLPPTASSISTTSSRGIVRNGAVVPEANLRTWSPPTGARRFPLKFSSSNPRSTFGQSKTVARFPAARNMPSPRCAFFRRSMKVPSKPHRSASQPGKLWSTNPTSKACLYNWGSSSGRPIVSSLHFALNHSARDGV